MTNPQEEFSGLVSQILYKVILSKLAQKLSEDGLPSEIPLNGSDESKNKILELFKGILGLESSPTGSGKRPDLKSLNKKGGRSPKGGKTPKKTSYMEPKEYLKRIESDPNTILCSHVPVRGQNKNLVCCKEVEDTDRYSINSLEARCKDCVNPDGKPKSGNGEKVFADLKPSDAHANEIPDFNTADDEPVAAAISGNITGATSPTNLVVPDDEEDNKGNSSGGGEIEEDNKGNSSGGGEIESEEEKDDLEDFLSSIPVTESPKK